MKRIADTMSNYTLKKLMTPLFFCIAFLFSVNSQAQDIIPPQARCKVGFVLVLPASGIITIEAREFDDGSTDNVTDAVDLLFYLNNDPLFTSYTVNCDTFKNHNAIGTLIQEFSLSIRDEAGNISQCVVRLEVQDNKSLCGTAIISCSGNFYHWINKNPMLADPGCTSGPLQASYTVVLDTIKEMKICRNNDPVNGVTTADIVFIQRHLLGLREFNHPLYYFAADANNSNTVSAGDMSTLRKVVLGTVNDFSQWGLDSWAFYVADGFIKDSQFVKAPNEILRFDDLQNCPDSTDFLGIKIGDLTGDAMGGLNGSIVRDNPVLKIKADYSKENRALEFYSTEEIDLAACQIGFNGLPSRFKKLDIKSGQMSIGLNHVYVVNDELRLSWNTDDGLSASFEADSPLFSIELSQEESLNVMLDQSHIPALGFDEDLNSQELQLEFDNRHSPFEVFQNTPNPFRDETIINIEAFEEVSIYLNIYNQYGSKVYQMKTVLELGSNEIKIKNNDISLNGVYYYQLLGEGHTHTRKMIKF